MAVPQVVTDFDRIVAEHPDVSYTVAVIRALTQLVKTSSATTMTELTLAVEASARDLLQNASVKSVGLSAGVELFKRFLNATSVDFTELDACKAQMIHRGELFVQKADSCRQQIGRFASQFIRDGTVILVHSHSRVVNALLLQAAAMNKRFSVYITETQPKRSGYRAAQVLRKAGIPVTVILDCAVGFFMNKVDMVLVGAEGVVENGGIINQVGTYQIALVAHASSKPFYAVVESYKFVRYFPLNQYDLPSTVPLPRLLGAGTDDDRNDVTAAKSLATTESEKHPGDDIAANNPGVDYTPPKYITLLFTDLGVLTPSAVGDELIKLYY